MKFILVKFINNYTYIIRMNKRKLTLSINEGLIKTAKERGINLSSFLEIKLEEHLALIHGKRNIRKQYADAGNRTRAEGLEGPNHNL